MGIKIYKTKFQHTHENEQFMRLAEMLIQKYGNSSEQYLLMSDCCDCDAVFVKKDAFIIIEMKDYSGALTINYDRAYDNPQVTSKEKYMELISQIWLIDGTKEVKGGSQMRFPKNPFTQCLDNKRSIGKHIDDKIMPRVNARVQLSSHAIVLFNKLDNKPTMIDSPAKSWFHITDMNGIVDTIDGITTSNRNYELKYENEDILMLPGKLGYSPFDNLFFPSATIEERIEFTISCTEKYTLAIDGYKFVQSKDGKRVSSFQPDNPIKIKLPSGTYHLYFKGISQEEDHTVSKSKTFYLSNTNKQYTANLDLIREEERRIQEINKKIQEQDVEYCIVGVKYPMCRVEPDTQLFQTATNEFFIGKHPVTKKLWNRVVKNVTDSGLKLSDAPTDDSPVTDISYEDCVHFIKIIGGLTSYPFRLPSKKEWEYAAHGGKYNESFCFAGSDNPHEVAWFRQRCDSVQPVGQLKPNALGLYDMCGNVWEYCNSGSMFDKTNGENDEVIALGGSWLSLPDECAIGQPSNILHLDKRFGNRTTGFRLAITPNDSINVTSKEKV